MPKARPADALIRLGRRLRARRLYMQLPLAYTANVMQLSPWMLSQYESGRAHPPCMTLLRMAKALGTSTSDLLAERNKGNADDVHFALKLFVDPVIRQLATRMHRMPPVERRAVLELMQTSARFK